MITVANVRGIGVGESIDDARPRHWQHHHRGDGSRSRPPWHRGQGIAANAAVVAGSTIDSRSAYGVMLPPSASRLAWTMTDEMQMPERRRKPRSFHHPGSSPWCRLCRGRRAPRAGPDGRFDAVGGPVPAVERAGAARAGARSLVRADRHGDGCLSVSQRGIGMVCRGQHRIPVHRRTSTARCQHAALGGV